MCFMPGGESSSAVYEHLLTFLLLVGWAFDLLPTTFVHLRSTARANVYTSLPLLPVYVPDRCLFLGGLRHVTCCTSRAHPKQNQSVYCHRLCWGNKQTVLDIMPNQSNPTLLAFAPPTQPNNQQNQFVVVRRWWWENPQKKV